MFWLKEQLEVSFCVFWLPSGCVCVCVGGWVGGWVKTAALRKLSCILLFDVFCSGCLVSASHDRPTLLCLYQNFPIGYQSANMDAKGAQIHEKVAYIIWNKPQTTESFPWNWPKQRWKPNMKKWNETLKWETLQALDPWRPAWLQLFKGMYRLWDSIASTLFCNDSPETSQQSKGTPIPLCCTCGSRLIRTNKTK